MGLQMGRDGAARAALAVLAGAAFLGFSPIAVRLSEVGPQATCFWRFVLALPILGVLAAGGAPKPTQSQAWAVLAAGVLFGLNVALSSAALSFTTVANATLLANMTPVFAAVFGWLLFRERLGAAVLAGGAVALVGAVTLALARAQAGQGPAHAEAGWIGDGLGLCSALWYAGYLMIVRRLGGRVSVGAIMFWAAIGSSVLALIAVVVMGETLFPQTLRGWAILLGLAWVVQVCGQGLIAYGVGRLPIAASTPLLWMQPLAAAALSWLMFDERLGPFAFVGAALILGGVWFVQRASSRAAAAASGAAGR
jgi:drug/metabolite transporter (DMT)-like permease